MLEIGSIVDGKYKILSQIGKGGMSIVYLAINERANKSWAIKEVRKDGKRDYNVVKQGLIVEMEMLKNLRHPYLPSIVDVIDKDDSFLIVMDYIEGKPLSKALEKNKVLPQEYVIEWAKQLCEVLGYLHSRPNPIIYRDLKPDNIMLKPDGSITLIDFGIAREYKPNKKQDTIYLGTQGYAAPEQFGGNGQTDARTDIYCLGATLYHLVTGHNPADEPYEIYPIRHWNMNLSQGLEQIICKCTQRNPKDRYQSCAEILYALDHYQDIDNNYSKKQKIKLSGFCVSLIFTILFLGMAAFIADKENRLLEENYSSYIRNAKSGITEQEQKEYYNMAFELEPENPQTYLDMIDQMYLNDDILTIEEDSKIRALLIKRSYGGKTYEELLKNNLKGYEEFAYKMGLAYFYSYEEQGNKALSTKWLSIASSASTLKEVQIERAQKLNKISQYYAKLGVENKAGDTAISYAQYWQDLCGLAQDNIAETDNATTALMVYKEIIYQIYVNGMKFKNSGIEKNDMQQQIENIQNRIVSDIDENEVKQSERLQILMDELQKNIELAQVSLSNMYMED